MEISVYQKTDENGSLCQGELLSNIRTFNLAEDSYLLEEPSNFELVEHLFGIILTADCDLAQDFQIRRWKAGEARQPESVSEANWKQNLLISVLIAPVYLASTFKPGVTRHWPQIRQNSHSRYQFLSDVSANQDLMNEGFPSLVIDFRQYFSVSASELYACINGGKTFRRTQLSSPYLQHFITRFGQHISRVALEIEHSELSTFCEIGQFNQLTEKKVEESDIAALDAVLKHFDS